MKKLASFQAYNTYDQATLDAQYNPRASVPDHVAIFERHAQMSEKARYHFPCRLDVAYGPSDAERLDIFPSEIKGAPVLIYFHGGFWRSRDKADFSFLSRAFVPLGATLVLVNYALCPAVSMDTLIGQCFKAIAWTQRHCTEFGGDSERVFVAGHSAGAHIATMALIADAEGSGPMPKGYLKGGTAISGLFELEPVRRSYVNSDLRLTPEQVERNSPWRHLPNRSAPLVVTVGQLETAEFRRQSLEFGEAWTERGLPGETFEVPHHHHYTILDVLLDPTSRLMNAMRQQIGI